MLTARKIINTVDLIKLLLKFYNNKISTSDNLENYSFNCNNSTSYNSSVLIDDFDGWFIGSVHTIRDETAGTGNKTSCNINETMTGDRDCTMYNNPSLQLGIRDKELEYPVLGNFQDLESQLFQQQTLHDDEIILVQCIQYYCVHYLSEVNYVSYNITKLLNISDEQLESVLTKLYALWSEHADHYAPESN